MSYVLTLDNVQYPHIHVTSLTRNFTVMDGENAGRVQSLAMVRDVKGTFYNYSIEIDPDMRYKAEYDSFYQVITAPVDSHTLVVPYGQETLTFEAYVTQGSDELILNNPSSYRYGGNAWQALSFNFIAMAPQRRAGEE